MTTSRKLVTALILLASGYGLALALSGLTDLVFPSVASPSESRSDSGGLLATLKGFVPHYDAAPAGQLVPESEFAANYTERSKLEPPQPHDHPTWLVTTPAFTTEPPVASTPAFAAGPTLSENRPPELAPIVPTESADLMPRPIARITDVVGASGESSANSASPWDRWPRWEPSPTKAQGGAVAAGLQTMEPVKSRATRAAFESVDSRRARHLEAEAADDDSKAGRTHVVVDGDSLAKLADRYLDDPALGGEIFRLNRDVLTDPEVLPIGVELRIPDGRTADSTSAIPAAKSSEATKPSPPSGMVPVDRMPKAFESVPRAELLRPIPAGRSD